MAGKVELRGKLSYLESVFERVDESTLQIINVRGSACALIADMGVIEPVDVISDKLTVEVFHAF